MPYSNATKQAFADALRKLLEQILKINMIWSTGFLTLKLQRFFQKKNGKMPALHGIYWKKSVSIFINTGHSIRKYCRLRGRTLLQNISGIF